MGAKRRVAPATAAAIASSNTDPKKSGDGTETSQEERRGGLSERALWFIRRSGLAAVVPFPSARSSGDASGTCHNWAAIAASPSRPQMKSPLAKSKVAGGVMRPSTRRTFAQYPGWWTHLVRPRTYPSGRSEESSSGLIVKTARGGRKKHNLPGAGLRVHVSSQIRNKPALIPHVLPLPPDFTQIDPGGDEKAISLRAKDPTEE